MNIFTDELENVYDIVRVVYMTLAADKVNREFAQENPSVWICGIDHSFTPLELVMSAHITLIDNLKETLQELRPKMNKLLDTVQQSDEFWSTWRQFVWCWSKWMNSKLLFCSRVRDFLQTINMSN